MDINRSDIPLRYRNVALTHEVPVVSRWIQEAAVSSGPLIISGQVGTGKTHLACGALRWYFEHNEGDGVYLSSRGFSSDDVSVYARCGLLVIDELGTGVDELGTGVDERLEEALGELICARYNAANLARTIVITTVRPGDFDVFFGYRVADRLRERSTLVLLDGTSRRKPLA